MISARAGLGDSIKSIEPAYEPASAGVLVSVAAIHVRSKGVGEQIIFQIKSLYCSERIGLGPRVVTKLPLTEPRGVIHVDEIHTVSIEAGVSHGIVVRYAKNIDDVSKGAVRNAEPGEAAGDGQIVEAKVGTPVGRAGSDHADRLGKTGIGAGWFKGDAGQPGGRVALRRGKDEHVAARQVIRERGAGCTGRRRAGCGRTGNGSRPGIANDCDADFWRHLDACRPSAGARWNLNHISVYGRVSRPIDHGIDGALIAGGCLNCRCSLRAGWQSHDSQQQGKQSKCTSTNHNGLTLPYTEKVHLKLEGKSLTDRIGNRAMPFTGQAPNKLLTVPAVDD